MLAQILKERLVSIDKFDEKLNKDIRKLQVLKEANNEVLVKNVYELEELMLEMMDFLSIYKNELADFLVTDDYTFETYKVRFSERDEQFYGYLNALREKESIVVNLR